MISIENLDFTNVDELHKAVKNAGGKDLSDEDLGNILESHYNKLKPSQRYSLLLTCGFTDDALERYYNFDRNAELGRGFSLEDFVTSYRNVFAR